MLPFIFNHKYDSSIFYFQLLVISWFIRNIYSLIPDKNADSKGVLITNIETGISEEVEFDKAYSKELKYYNITEQTIDSLRPLMKDFYQKSEFGKFFKDNEEYYKKAITVIEANPLLFTDYTIKEVATFVNPKNTKSIMSL